MEISAAAGTKNGGQMKLLVIGGKGFIGGAYCRKIVEYGHSIDVYDLPEDNLLDRDNLTKHIKDNDCIIHFAAMANVEECIIKQDETFETNVLGTYQIAKYCRDLNKKLIFISTCCVYGNSVDAVETEFSTRPNATEPYAVSKIAGEYIIQGMPHLNYIILRIGTVYGPGQREALFTHRCLSRILNSETIYIDGDGEQTRQLIYIDDLINAICKATNNSKTIINEIINLCGKEKTSAMDTMRVAAEVIGKVPVYEHRQQRYGQTFHENISIDKAKLLLQWEPTISFKDGMKKTFEIDPRFK
jgi:nucleoside-diphosphate-sugar epimerase